ncbi:hypothetical protein [Flammeovirga kamogawensis]|uniref:Uncharacterized protein n=2 Tax=Flammeovirga kamogawensis TaxID=373891 RepID=A0ABX8H1V9_9BACT|nr:hypothetical protein [Flammeovirga kamogawensis]MBB6464125.1 hypothetical protein [Flammeovirga kamogawensis]QWG09886.1 hypothetical protein KM029_19590 [Flammeovirga kamogawensis]TRX65390.1 hypothetical protein EO216_22985 [Flammeovirga kamogawensis]
MSGIWKHKATIIDGQTFKLKELNIWDYQWEDTGNSIQIKDPMYGKDYKLNIYRIVKENIKIQFAAGEFSNCVWGIYLEST